MDKLSEFLKTKRFGFYAIVVVAVLSLVVAIAYPACFSAEEEMSWLTFVLSFAAFLVIAAAIALEFLLGNSSIEKDIKHFAMPAARVASFGCAIGALMLFVDASFQMITRMSLGMEMKNINIMTFYGAGLPLCAMLFILFALAATAAVFMPLRKKVNDAQEVQA